MDRPRDIPVNLASELVNSWTAYREVLDDGVSSSTRSIDFILIEPLAGGGRASPSQRRREIASAPKGTEFGLWEMAGYAAGAAITYGVAKLGVGYRSW